MSAIVGWGLAVLATALGYVQYGWPGVALAVSMVVFWLLLQFTRTLRAMREAGQSPVGHVDSAVMLNARLRRGMTLLQAIRLTRSLGERIGDGEDPETWRWTDGGGSTVTLALRRGKLADWSLARPPAPDQAAVGSAPASGADTVAGADGGPGGPSSR